MSSRIALAALALALAACSTTTVPVRYYTLGLDPEAPQVKPVTGTARVRIAIAPISLPESLDRSNLVLRTSSTRVQVLEQDRWADGLKQEIPRVVAERIGARQPRLDVSYYPQIAAERADYTLTLDVQRFDAERGAAITVDLRWSLLGPQGAMLRSGHLHAREACRGDSVDAVVDADARALRRIADELAAALADLAPPIAPKSRDVPPGMQREKHLPDISQANARASP